MGEKTINPNKKPKSKKKKILVEHKPIVIGGIIAAVAIAGIVGGIVLFLGEKKIGGTFIFGYGGGLDRIDPLIANLYDPIIIASIAEPLFTEYYNQTGKYYENSPHLAEEGTWSPDGLNFTCTLKKGVEFHDGTKFNASAVKWNFDRLHNLLVNMSIYGVDYLWYHPDGTLILNRTEIINDYTVRFVLNRPFVPFRALLTIPHAYILSPASTPEDRFLDAFTEKLIGTGPYIYESNVVYVNTTIIKNKNYWGTPKPVMDTYVFIPYSYQESNEHFFAKETDYAVGNDSLLEEYSADSTIVVDDFVEHGFDYLGMNNKRINTTMRKAISYALNYTSILELADSLSHGSNIRCRSPLSLETLYSNWEDFDVPYYNITKARQTLKDVNWPGTTDLTANNIITIGNEWETIANMTPLMTLNISYIFGGWNWLEELSYIIVDNLKQIGVKVENLPLTYEDHWDNVFASKIDLFWLGWLIDYNDPSNTLNAIFSTQLEGWNNFQQTNDSIVQGWLDQGTVETNPFNRSRLYYDIQRELIERVYPVAWLYSNVWFDVYRSNVRGWGIWGAGSLRYIYRV
ncbi:MAG: ABC transporter substrate-binding protein [Promethearchaeota archaeon]